VTYGYEFPVSAFRLKIPVFRFQFSVKTIFASDTMRAAKSLDSSVATLAQNDNFRIEFINADFFGSLGNIRYLI
jgi:hypothetical protein